MSESVDTIEDYERESVVYTRSATAQTEKIRFLEARVIQLRTRLSRTVGALSFIETQECNHGECANRISAELTYHCPTCVAKYAIKECQAIRLPQTDD